MLRGRLAFTIDTFLTLIRWQHAEPHPVLASAPTWYSETAERALDEQARAELAEQDLLGADGPVPELTDAIAAVVRPDREFYGWITTTMDGELCHYGVLAGQVYKEGFVLVRDQDHGVVLLASIPASRLLDGFMSQIPAQPPATGRSVTMPYDSFLAAVAAPDESGVGMIGGPANPEANALKSIFARPRTGAGNLYAAIRTKTGNRRRVEHPTNYIDTTTGRWLTQLTMSGGQRWATAAPATPKLIATRLREQAAALADR